MSRVLNLNKFLILFGLYFMMGTLAPSFASLTEIRKLQGQGVLSLIKNNKLVEVPMSLAKHSQVHRGAGVLKDLKVFLMVDSLKFSDEKLAEQLKSSVFFDSKNYKFIEVSSVANLLLTQTKGDEETFSGELLLKIKNKSQKFPGQVVLKRTSKECALGFNIEVPDRTKKLGLKYNSKKFSSEVELGENLIDDKLSFSVQAKCN